MSVTHPNVRGADRTGELVLLWSVIGLLVMGLGTVELALRLGDSADHVHQQLPANPFMLVLRLAGRDTSVGRAQARRSPRRSAEVRCWSWSP